MRHVIIEWRDDEYAPSYWLDPQPYLDLLPALAEELPPGARAFALDPAHYAFGDSRCVKNLKLVNLAFGDGPGLVAVLSPNPWMHTEALVIEYSGVSALSVEVEDQSDEEYPAGLDRLLLDEILPAEAGCTHEIRFSGGFLNITCADLTADWRPRPPAP